MSVTAPTVSQVVSKIKGLFTEYTISGSVYTSSTSLTRDPESTLFETSLSFDVITVKFRPQIAPTGMAERTGSALISCMEAVVEKDSEGWIISFTLQGINNYTWKRLLILFKMYITNFQGISDCYTHIDNELLQF